MIEFKTIKTLKPSEKVLKTINYTRPIKLSVKNGEIRVITPTNIQTITPIKYIITYDDRKIELNEYPISEIKGNNFYNVNTKKSFNETELIKNLKETTCKF